MTPPDDPSSRSGFLKCHPDSGIHDDLHRTPPPQEKSLTPRYGLSGMTSITTLLPPILTALKRGEDWAGDSSTPSAPVGDARYRASSRGAEAPRRDTMPLRGKTPAGRRACAAGFVSAAPRFSAAKIGQTIRQPRVLLSGITGAVPAFSTMHRFLPR